MFSGIITGNNQDYFSESFGFFRYIQYVRKHKAYDYYIYAPRVSQTTCQ